MKKQSKALVGFLLLSMTLNVASCALVRNKDEAKKPDTVNERLLQAEEKEMDITAGTTTPYATKSRPKGDKMAYGRIDKVPEPVDDGTEFNTEGYDHIAENPFLEVLKNPLSTFSIDVDTASYSNIRRFLNDGQLPPKDAVRIEEMINYFNYDYPDPEGKHPFSLVAEVSDCPWNTRHQLVHIGLQGQRVDLKKTPPNNLVFLLDVSGSMNDPNKLPLLKRSIRLMVEQLREEDKVSIAVYAGAAGLVLPPTSGIKKNEILQALDRLEAGGSTAGGAGIKLAYEQAKKTFISHGNNRVILATDGDFNVGQSSDGELVRMIEDKRKDGIFLTVLGFGTGNYKDSKMEKLADKGNGNYAYIDNLMEARKVLVSELGGTLLTIAKDVKLQVEFNPTKVASYRLIGYENRIMRAEDFHDDKKDAGELGAGHSVTALYEIVPANGAASTHDLKYQETTVKDTAKYSKDLLTLRLRYKKTNAESSQLIELPVLDQKTNLAKASENFRFSAAVAGFGLWLRDSEHKGDLKLEQVIEMARHSKGADRGGYRQELLAMMEKAQKLK